MEVLKRILVGLFIGLLCGLVPLIYGLLMKHKLSSIIAFVLTALMGVVFAYIEKSPFSAMVVSMLFILISVAEKKKHSKSDHSDEE